MSVTVDKAEVHFVDRMIFEALQPMLEKALNKAGDDAVESIKELISVPVEIDPVTGKVIRSNPGEPPRTETGELLNNIGADIISDVSNMTITLHVISNRPSTPEVPWQLEGGAPEKNLARRPYMSRAFEENIERWKGIVLSAIGGEA